jgi:hypothetical protein
VKPIAKSDESKPDPEGLVAMSELRLNNNPPIAR